jgi:hypothetical protein
MDDLTDDQKLQIECGLATFEQVQKDMRGSVVGDKVNEVRLHRPTNAYDNSPSLLTEYDENDFIMEFEVPDENLDDVLNQIGDAIGDAIGGGMSKEELDILSMFK